MKRCLKLVSKLSVSGLLIACSAAWSGVITDFEGTGVDFYSSWLNPTTLRIEIDAANPSGGWANAVSIDSIAINAPSSWSWASATDITLYGPGTFGGGIVGTGLNSKGCQSLTLGGNHPCWGGLATLADDMYFDFVFADVAMISSYTDNPHLKVRFVDANGGKVGSLLSEDLRTVDAVEPSSIAMLLLGVCGLIAARRRVRS